MSSLSGMRVGATVVGVVALVFSVVCPWWRYRWEEDLYRVAMEFPVDSPSMALAGIRPDLETYVGVLPIWDVADYQVADLLLAPTLLQVGLILTAWAWCMEWARRYDL